MVETVGPSVEAAEVDLSTYELELGQTNKESPARRILISAAASKKTHFAPLLTISHPLHSFPLPPSVHLALSITSTHPPFSLQVISLFLTDATWRAGLPVVSVFHLNAGDLALSLQLVTRVTREGHGVAGLPPLSVAAAIHRDTWISAGCCKRT